MRRPLNEPCQITSHYGERVLNGVKQFHPGLDLVAANRSVFAVADGIVCFDYDNYNEKNRWNGASLDSTGNLVIIKSEIGGKTYFIRYMHLVKNLVSDKQPIKEGQLLGEYGDVGFSYGPHVHVDVCDTFGKWGNVDPATIRLK